MPARATISTVAGILTIELEDDRLLVQVEREIEEYLAGRRKKFDVAVNPPGTVFQQKVWRRLCSIPYGQTATYSEVARDIGHPGAGRAVGSACGRNPAPVVIPCHRVLAKNGWGGYSGGLGLKKFLLSVEQKKSSGNEGSNASL